MTLLNVLGVLFNVLNVLNGLKVPRDASLACWALLWNYIYGRIDEPLNGPTDEPRMDQ